jgi:hypothetical protein
MFEFFCKLLPTSLSKMDIIRLLTQFRISNYSQPELIPDSALPSIKTFVANIGDRILDSQIADQEKRAYTKREYSNSLYLLFTDNKKITALKYAAQILQFHTLLCQKESIPALDAEAFYKFLDGKVGVLGVCNNNLFITEYKLIKIYNDLCHYYDSVKGLIAPVIDIKSKKDFLFEKLSELTTIIQGLMLEEPDNIFYQYLNFSVKYSMAKAVELEYHLTESTLSSEEKPLFVGSQTLCLEHAYKSILAIEKLMETQVNSGRTKLYVGGQAYTLGQSVLSSLPIDNIELIKAHVQSKM